MSKPSFFSTAAQQCRLESQRSHIAASNPASYLVLTVSLPDPCPISSAKQSLSFFLTFLTLTFLKMAASLFCKCLAIWFSWCSVMIWFICASSVGYLQGSLCMLAGAMGLYFALSLEMLAPIFLSNAVLKLFFAPLLLWVLCEEDFGDFWSHRPSTVYWPFHLLVYTF